MTKKQKRLTIIRQMKKIEIKDFELFTTGIISIAWKEGGKDMFLNVDLDLAAMLKLLKIEGISYEKVQQLSDNQEPITFHKASVYLFQEDDRPGQYCLSEAMFEDDGIDIYYAEIKG